jgi:hypothetical protein
MGQPARRTQRSERAVLIDLVLDAGPDHIHLKVPARFLNKSEMLLLDLESEFYVADAYIEGRHYRVRKLGREGNDIRVEISPHPNPF